LADPATATDDRVASPSPGRTSVLIAAIAILATAFHLFAAGVYPFTALVQRPVHLAFMATLGFLGAGIMGKRGRTGGHSDAGQAGEFASAGSTVGGQRPSVFGRPAVDRRSTVARARTALTILLIAAALFSCGYLVLEHTALMRRVGMPTTLDLLAGAIAVIVVLELARRATGWGLVGVALLAIAYALAGPWLPGMLAHRGYSVTRIIEQLYLSTEGIWGIPLGVSADFVFLFVLFGAILDAAGGGELLIGLAARVAGRTRGGPAKTASVASALMGSLSGSAVANVATTGAVTIPLMKRSGFRPYFAAAIEAAASTGGQLMPPIMGAGAFILATWTNIPYAHVALAALVPALLYYVALFMAIHFRAGRMGLEPGSTQSTGPVVARLHLLVSLAVIVALLAMGRSPMRAAFWGVVTGVLMAMLRSATRLDARTLRRALVAGAAGTVQVAAACATAGIVVGVASLTGIGLRMSELVITLANGHLPIALGLTAIGSIIIGMGLPTTAAYVVLAALGAPALVNLGVPLLAAHLFIFYFGAISNVTPPVSLAAYAAAGIAEASALRTALTAMGLAAAGFIVPFMFVYAPPLLLNGLPGTVAISVVTAFVGVTALAAAVIGYARRPLAAWERLLLAAAAISLIAPGMITDLFGAGVMALTFLWKPAAAGPGGGGRRGPTKRRRILGTPAGPAGMVILAALVLVSGCGERSTVKRTSTRHFLSIGTAGTGGIYYPLGGAIASRLSARDSVREFTAEVSGGSLENIQRIANGQIDLGFSTANTVYEAYVGGQDFARPLKSLRIVAPLYPNVVQVLVRLGSGIRSMEDLRGRRVSVGSSGSGTEELSRQLLAAYGITYDDIDERFLSFTESASALRDGAVDAAIFSVGYPASAVLEVTSTGIARLIPISGDGARRLRERHSYYSTGVIPADAYPGQDHEIQTIAVMNWLVADSTLNGDVVREVLDVLDQDRSALRQVAEIAGQIRLDALADAPIPLHPAARAWLREQRKPN
jgi:TRAP transporter 4TM/12TM fusion protein/TRAP transporter TAXI family solute receptor